jgi:hypothetical protein
MKLKNLMRKAAPAAFAEVFSILHQENTEKADEFGLHELKDG